MMTQKMSRRPIEQFWISPNETAFWIEECKVDGSTEIVKLPCCVLTFLYEKAAGETSYLQQLVTGCSAIEHDFVFLFLVQLHMLGGLTNNPVDVYYGVAKFEVTM
jgi:hypothetical protein